MPSTLCHLIQITNQISLQSIKLTTGALIVNLHGLSDWYTCLTDHHIHTVEEHNITCSEDLKNTY